MAGRGYDVAVAEALDVFGGRVTRERLLLGLSAWGRVVDYITYQIGQKTNVQMYPGSALTADEVLDYGFQSVGVATGAKWRVDGVARMHVVPMLYAGILPVFTGEDIMEGRMPSDRIVVLDDAHYHIGGVLDDVAAQNGCDVTLVTTSVYLSDWTINKLRQGVVNFRLVAVRGIVLNTGVSARILATTCRSAMKSLNWRRTDPITTAQIIAGQARGKWVELRHVSKSFGNYQALNDVSFDIYDNEAFTLLGLLFK